MDFSLLLGVLRFLLATTLILLLTVPTAFVVIQMELKIIAGTQLRYGPNRIGPWGMFQSTIHGFKVLAKEDHIPDQADRATFTDGLPRRLTYAQADRAIEMVGANLH